MGGKLLKAIKAKQPNRVLGALKLGAPANILGGEVSVVTVGGVLLAGTCCVVEELCVFHVRMQFYDVRVLVSGFCVSCARLFVGTGVAQQ